MKRIALLMILWPLTLAWSAPAGEPRELVTRFVEAWNAHDPAAFGSLMAEDADWVTASGIRLRGREAIQAFLAEEHSTWARVTTMRDKSIQLRLVDENHAVVLFEWEISTPGEAGAAATVARGNNLFVARFGNEGWIIVAGQVARART